MHLICDLDPNRLHFFRFSLPNSILQHRNIIPSSQSSTPDMSYHNRQRPGSDYGSLNAKSDSRTIEFHPLELE